MRLEKTLLVVLLGCVAFAICPRLYGQATGSLSGTISDETGSVIAGAAVKVTAQQTGVSRETKTDDSGYYLLPLLPVGTYTIRAEAASFQAAEQKSVRLQVDEHREVNFTLSPGAVTETVTVTGTEIAVQSTTPTLGQVITSQQVAQLPLNGRNFVQLATLTPGTVQETNPDSFFNGGPSSEVSTRGSFSLSVGGSRASSTDWLLDGNDNNELTAGGISIQPSIDAIQEFKVLTYNYSAQYGTRAGPTVLLTTKSGSNEFHGSVFNFLRNTNLDARSYFAAEREKFIQNQFGGSIGGPIKRDKTFFFFDFQGRRSRQGKPFVGQVPTAAMRNGDFSEAFADIGQLFNPFSTQLDMGTGQVTRDPFMCDGSGNPTAVNANGTQVAGTPCNIIPQALINPIAQEMINLYPLPNVGGTLVGNFLNSPVRKLDENQFDVRIDHNFSSNDSLFGRFSYDQATVFIPGGSDGFATANTFGSTQDIANKGRNVAISETHIFSPTAINQLSFGYNRIFNFIESFGAGSCKAQELGIPGANLGGISCGLTSTQIGGGFWSLGDRGFAPFQGGTNVFHIADSFDMVRGRHNIKVGGEVRANQLNVRTNAFQDGFWIFSPGWTASVVDLGGNFFAAVGPGGNNMASFLLGLPDLALHDQTFQGETTGRRWKIFRPYIQDDWRVTNNLTLNLGLGWALVTPITEALDRQSNFDFATGEFLIPGQTSDSRVGIQMDKTAFEPRIGLAWSPGGSQKTAVRAGYAIYHDSSWNQGGQGLWENPPFFAESAFAAFFPDLCPSATSICATSGLAVTGKSMSDGFPILSQPTDPSTFSGNIFSQNLDFNLGMIQQYNFSVERELPGQIVFTAGYAGSRSTRILVDQQNLNVTSPSACGITPGYTLGCGITTIPYPQFGSIFNIHDRGSARYDSLQLKAETRSRSGLYALFGYTYSRAFDNGFADGLGTPTGTTYFPLPGTAQFDWALSQVHLNHNFTASVIYELPFGKGKRFGSSWGPALNAVLGNWELDLIQKITSGFPLFVISSTSVGPSFSAQNGAAANRPNQICDGRLDNPTPAQFFDTSCFVASPPGQLGTANRAPLYGPGFVNTDFSAVKFFPIRESTKLEFRAEFFNLFNHPQFFLPGGELESPDFGRITRTVNNPRLIQFALRLSF